MSDMAISRLREERRILSRSKHPDFMIQRAKNPDGTSNIMIWECYISGKKNTAWEDSKYFLRMKFDENYPINPPCCRFDPPLFHPNIFPSGTVCLSLLDKDWLPSITVLEILQAIQNLLIEPDMKTYPAFALAHHVYRANPDEYEMRIRLQAKKMSNPEKLGNFNDDKLIFSYSVIKI